MRRYNLVVILFLLSFPNYFLPALIYGSEPSENPDNSNSENTLSIKPDDPIVATLDSLANLKVYKNLELNIESFSKSYFDFPLGFIPEYSDSVYKSRFEELDRMSPIDFEYNSSVKTYIDLYGRNRRDLTERIMGLAELYFPYFEEQLDKYNLPLELKYITVIESALNPVARSPAGATGIWQFMYGTGRLYDLEVNSYVDDRADVIKSTVAACRHFVDLYNIYEDWLLAIAAYNSGAGNVNRAIRRSGGAKDFWSIRGFLPRETRNYVPAFMAVTYVMEYSHYHNLYPSPPPFTDLNVDTLHINQKLSLRNVSEILEIPLDHLRYLNPSFRKNIIPASENNTYILRIPQEYTGKFVTNKEKIHNYKTPEEIRQDELNARMEETTVHVVRQGEVLGSIARRYGCSVREIQRWNNLRGTLIRPGQRLVVRAPKPANTNIVTDNNVHVVRSGESLNIIADRYNVTTSDLIIWNNLPGTTIYPGQHIIVRPSDDIAAHNIDSEKQIKKDKTKGEYQTFIYYRVQEGDTLMDITEMHPGVTVKQIRELNNLSGEVLRPGKKLKIAVCGQ